MAKIPFSVSARTAKLIGQENFANADGAIVELVKNAYDADADTSIIIFDNLTEDLSLYLIDNGVGMTTSIIIDKWMMIGTDDKLQNHESDGGRVKTGAKGIGRFALDRLGGASDMLTVAKENGEASDWKVQWSDFEKLGISINEVGAELEQSTDTNIKDKLTELFGEYTQINEIIEEIEKKKNKDFNSGTILKISLLKDEWDEVAIKRLFDNLEVLIPPMEQPDFSVNLFSLKQLDEFGKVNSAYYDDYDYKISAKYLADKAGTIKVEVTRNELDVSKLGSDYLEIFDYKPMKEFPYKLDTFKKKTFELSMTIEDFPGFSTFVDKELIAKIGEFDFTYYFLKLTNQEPKKYPYLKISRANRKAWLNKFGGIKIFRDDFRVRPYGENGQDWLGLGKRQAESPGGPGQKMGGFRIGPNQVAGTVNISRIANASFQDKSGREGIQENEVFELFKNILVELIALFEHDRNVVMFNLSELAKKRNKAEEAKRKAREETERILKEKEERENNANGDTSSEDDPIDSENVTNTEQEGSTETEEILAQANVIYEQELEEKDTEIKLLRSLASVGLIISSFAHEVKGLRSRLVPRTNYLLTELKKHITKEDLKSVNKQDNPLYMVQLIQEEDLKLKHWLDYSLSALKKDKRTRTNLNIGEYFEQFEAVWDKALKQRKIKLNLTGTKDSKNVFRAFEVDMDAIFNNLLSNSLNAFKERKGKYDRVININWKNTTSHIEIEFSDNGSGLAKEYIDNPDRIFNFNETSKRDRKGNIIGTGMGLYIVNLVIEDYNGSELEILNAEGGFTIKVSLALRKKED